MYGIMIIIILKLIISMDNSGSNQNAVNMEGFHVGHMNIILSGSTVIILLGVALLLWYWKAGRTGCCATSSVPPAQPPTTSPMPLQAYCAGNNRSSTVTGCLQN